MPNITIDIWEGRDRDTKQKLIQKISNVAAEVLETDISRVVVIINEVKKDNWGLNGDQASRKW